MTLVGIVALAFGQNYGYQGNGRYLTPQGPDPYYAYSNGYPGAPGAPGSFGARGGYGGRGENGGVGGRGGDGGDGL